jgi:hypothetical protein
LLSKSKTRIVKLNVSSKQYEREHDIAKCLKEYFCNIGKHIANSVSCVPNASAIYWCNSNKHSMFCEPVSPEEIIKLTSELVNNKSVGPDNIGPKLVELISI